MNSCDSITATPPRRQVGTTRGSVSGLMRFRNGDSVAFESTLERDFLVRLATDPRVQRVISQPVTINYTDQRRQQRSYTPDYLVEYEPGPALWEPFLPAMLVEVKPRAKLKKHLAQWKPRYRAAIRYCKEHACVFHLMDERRIRDQRWQNAMFLRRYRRMRFEPVDGEWVIANLQRMGTASFDHLLARHFSAGYRDRAEGIAHLWHLLATERITCDLSLPLNNFTELWVPDHG